MKALVDKVKALKLAFTDLMKKLADAKIDNARELALLVWLMAEGKVQPEAAEVEVALSVIKELDTNWAKELEEAGQQTVTIAAPDQSLVDEALDALGEGGEEEKKPDSEKKKDEGEKNASEGGPGVKVAKLTETAKPDDKDKQIAALSEQIVKLRGEKNSGAVAKLTEPNKKGVSFAPAVVGMVKALLVHEGGGPVNLSDKVTANDSTEAFLTVLEAVRDGGLVQLNEQTKTNSTRPGTGKFYGGLLAFTDEDVPADVRARYVARLGESVSDESIVLSELMDALQAKAKSENRALSRKEALREARKLMASTKQEN